MTPLEHPPMTASLPLPRPVLLQAWYGDGNDPVEVEILLPIIPRKGDVLSLWESRGTTGEEHFFDVKSVVLCAYAPERVVVLLDTDGTNREEFERVFAAVGRGDRP